MRIVLEIIVRDELNYISGHILTVALGVKGLVVTIKSFHAAEIGIANTNNDDSHRQLGASHNLVNRLVHVVDDTVCDYDENVEFLVATALHITLNMAANLIKDR